MDLLDRLYRKLRDAAARQYPASAAPSFTVAELYQQLIPYRAVRGELGILELAEYEHALLRLLAGERGFVRLELPQVQDELRKELSSPSPILGIYRDYAAIGVELTPGAELPTVPERTRLPDAPTLPERRPSAHQPVPLAAPASAPATGGACLRCGGALPAEADLRFCPHCGADQREPPCTGCGQALRPEWNFCIRCGTPRPGARRAP